MFFTGTLQEGISTALQQKKQVVCFVTDDGEESRAWETEYLEGDTITESLARSAIVLRLLAGSEEAGYLEALFPVPRKPTLVVIHNGQLREYIAAGTSKEDFVRRLGAALAGTPSPGPTASEAAAGSSSAAPGPQVPSTDTASVAADQRPQQVSDLLAERARRLEADQKAREATAKAEKKAAVKERRSAEETDHAREVKKRKQDEKEARQRILQRIEDDKRARKEREAHERQARLLLSASQDPNDEGASGSGSRNYQASPIPLPIRGRAGDGPTCNLRVRLLDGSTTVNQFPGSSKITKVRDWIDESRTDGDMPYTFRIVMTPTANRAIEPSEENESLLSLGLAPSATLVLVPTVKVVSAYVPNGGLIGGLIGRGITYGYALLAFLWSIPGMLFRGRRVARRSEQEPEDIPMASLDGGASSPGRSQGGSARIGSLQSLDDRRRDQQFYNGNSLSFEPRRDDDENTD